MDLFKPQTRAKIIPRDYQTIDHDESFRLWDSGERGVLTRAFTSAGKTLMACLKADTWLKRSPNHRVLVVSYETQLVEQWAQEIEDYLGITPGIEMEKAEIYADAIPSITVASRASLLRAKQPTEDQITAMRNFGITDIGAAPERAVKKYLKYLQNGGDNLKVFEELEELNSRPEAKGNVWSRVHKFDWKLFWLIFFDEAHRHAHKLISVGHLVDWFDQNPESRRNGLTATPKRADGISLGDKMFPGVAIDYPLYSRVKDCAVMNGYAVPYVQKYISVEGVDFKQIKKIAGDFDDADLERVLGEESMLAKLIEPMLDMVGSRKTLIFSPGVQMAKNVARYINARTQTKCTCGIVKWFPTLLIGDGAKCSCGNMISAEHALASGERAKEIDGNFAPKERREIYRSFAEAQYQFLSVCGLCREGFNDPDVACVACFRPVSKKSSSLAEQMKGRAARVCRELAKLLHTFLTAEDRRQAIAESSKPNALIIDLVGITGLADCASTVQIYADGLPDEIIARADEIAVDQSDTQEVDIEECIEQAKREDAEAREKARLEREEAERRAKEEYEKRAKADVEVTYDTQEVGYTSALDPKAATTGQLKFIAALGMEVTVEISKKQAGRMISMLKLREKPQDVAYKTGLRDGCWKPVTASIKQLNVFRRWGVPNDWAKTPYDARQIFDARNRPEEFEKRIVETMAKAKTPDELTAVGIDVNLVRHVLNKDSWNRLVNAGKEARKRFSEEW